MLLLVLDFLLILFLFFSLLFLLLLVIVDVRLLLQPLRLLLLCSLPLLLLRAFRPLLAHLLRLPLSRYFFLILSESHAQSILILMILFILLGNQGGGVFLFETFSLLFICCLFPDADECTASPPVCHVKALCTNTNGSHRCTCKRGYTGNGTTCKGT